MSFIPARAAVGLDEAAALVTHVFWSEDGSNVSSKVAGTAVTLKAATVANPSIVVNDGALESAEASDAGTFTHFAFGHLDDVTPVLDTTWVELDDPAVLLEGGKITVADGALKEHWHATLAAPA